MNRERGARTRGHTLQVELGASHPCAQFLTTETHDRLERIYVLGGVPPGGMLGDGTAHRVPPAPSCGTVPRSITTMPPAVSRYLISRRPARSSFAASPAGAGKRLTELGR